MSQNKFDLDTPCLVLDLDILETNLQKMQESARAGGKKLRPHAKTHKSSALARLQLQTGAIGICAAKVSEAEALVRAGIQEILITGPVATRKKVERMVALLESAPTLMVVLDNVDGIELLSAVLRERKLKMDVLLDLDAGLHRTGARLAQALDLAALIASKPELRLRGIQAYAGQVQHIHGFETRKTSSLSALEGPAEIYRQLSRLYKDCNIFSASGTGTFDIDVEVPETTDLQVGSYAVMDSEYMAIGSPQNSEIFTSFPPALRLLTSVVSANQDGFVTVDAGLKSLYRDGGIPQIIGASSSWLVYDWFGDEFGKISAIKHSSLPALGSVLELIVSHCDPTINLFERYYLTRGSEVVGEWAIDLRGCSQ